MRLHVLAQLLGETYEAFHDTLTGSALAVPLLLLPFRRDARVTLSSLSALRAAASRCARAAGAALLAPEVRLSLHLKRLELCAAGRGSEAAALEAFEERPCFDIHDESDELMRCKLQLVYAIGAPQPLACWRARVAAGHALLLVLQHDPACAALAASPKMCAAEHAQGGARARPGGWYQSLRLLVDDAHASMPALRETLARAVIRSPPRELAWLGRLAGSAGEAAVVVFVADVSVHADAALAPASFEAPHHREGLLSLRGLLAGGVLSHCLRLRHRVSYGLACATRLAVPFRASDEPADRSKFQRACAALTLTSLSYCQAGLSAAQAAQAFAALLALGIPAQEALYTEWLALSRPGLADDEAAGVDSVRKLDPGHNPAQAALLARAYRFNPRVIHFWLVEVAQPSDTQQFPGRLRATAWHLAPPRAGRCAGFSGTKGACTMLGYVLSLPHLFSSHHTVRRQPPPPPAARGATRAADGGAGRHRRAGGGPAPAAGVRPAAPRRRVRAAVTARAALRRRDAARDRPRRCGRSPVWRAAARRRALRARRPAARRAPAGGGVLRQSVRVGGGDAIRRAVAAALVAPRRAPRVRHLRRAPLPWR